MCDYCNISSNESGLALNRIKGVSGGDAETSIQRNDDGDWLLVLEVSDMKPDETSIECCPKCGRELHNEYKDKGGDECSSPFMKKFRIPVSWAMESDVIVEAENLEQAIVQAKDAPLPNDDDSSYIECSFQVSVALIDENPLYYGELNDEGGDE